MRTGVRFLLSLLLCVGGGWLTGLATEEGVKEWYPGLTKPYGTPPDIVFPIVWTILYTLMAVSLTLLWSSKTTGKGTAYLFFFAQLFLNFIWSWIFFANRAPGLALVDLSLLWIAVLGTVFELRRHTPLGAYLLIPYLLWITYAGYLNFSIWWFLTAAQQ
jgi:tryptophan-rich sensory protein